MNPQNQKSLNLDLISLRNHRMNKREFSKIKIHKKLKLKLKLIQIMIQKLNITIKRKITMKHIPNPRLRLN